MMHLVLLVVIVLLSVVWLLRRKNHDKDGACGTLTALPAVPGALPILGNFHQVDKRRIDISMVNWAKQLGPVYTVKIFSTTWVVVSGFDELVEMCVTKGRAFGGRCVRYLAAVLTDNHHGLLHGDPRSAHWMPARKAAHRGIRHYGDGLTRLEATLAEMARDFVTKVASHGGREIDIKEDIYDFILKVSMTMLSGKKVMDDDTDDTLRAMKAFARLSLSTLGRKVGIELDLFPWLRHFGHPKYRDLLEMMRLRDQLWHDMRQQSADTYTADGEATCIVQAISQLMDKESSHFDPAVDIEKAKATFADLILASMVTTTSFAYALPNILLHHPNILSKLHEEIDSVIGGDRPPSIFDRDAMPYATATIYELLRYTSLLPTMAHATLESTSVGGYALPAGCIVVPLFEALHHDKQFWGDPEAFRPERFLTEDGSLLPADHMVRKHVMQFGVGTRACVGEAFALKRLFIYVTSLVQAFELKPGSGALVPWEVWTYPESAVINHPPYTLRLVPRH